MNESGGTKIKYSCDLIRDLMPLYCDEICSRDSAEAVREHIGGCESCEKLYLEMKQGTSLETSVNSAEYEKRQLSSMKQVKKKMKKKNTLFSTVGIVAGALLVVVAVRILAVVGVLIFAEQDAKKNSYTSTDINEYGTFERFRGYSKLDIFPEKISGGMEAREYFYYYADTFFDPTAQIYLECRYDGDAYLREIERLKAVREEHDGRVQGVLYDTESFSYPAYVAIDAADHCYEYALLLGEGRIAYIFLQFIGEEDIAFPSQYLPREYEQKKDGYSIYVFRGENGVSYCVY